MSRYPRLYKKIKAIADSLGLEIADNETTISVTNAVTGWGIVIYPATGKYRDTITGKSKRYTINNIEKIIQEL